jgi:membrane-bound lytic murein transglycosylase MltF
MSAKSWPLTIILWLGVLVILFGAPVKPAKPAPGEAVPWQSTFQRVAGPRWIERAAQVGAESGFNALAISPVGAKGGAQFMDGAWHDWARPGESPFDPNAFIPAQHRYMSWLEAKAGQRLGPDGRRDPALSGYNWGWGNVQRVLNRSRAMGSPDPRFWVSLLPNETKNYLRHNDDFRRRIQAALRP